MQPTNSLAESLASLPELQRLRFLKGLTEPEARRLLTEWRFWARPAQLIPGTAGAANSRTDWRFWVVNAGRGFGKTLTGAQATRTWGESKRERILLIAPTAGDVRDTMLEGPSGLFQCYPPDRRPTYIPSRRLIIFPSGAIGITRSADEPERLRGPQFTKFWADELCAWRFVKDAWDQIMFGFRLATANIQGVITTTPRPIPTYRALLKNPRTVVTGGSSFDNRLNLSQAYFEDVIAPYLGTRLGRQEIEAELLEDTPGALWTRALIEATRVAAIPDDDYVVRTVLAIDPAVSTSEGSALTGMVVVSLTKKNHLYVRDDLSARMTPGEWAHKALRAYLDYKCDRIVAETNNGGDLVEANLRGYVATLGHNPLMLPFRKVHASKGKIARAEPVASIYEQRRAHHVGAFPQLEDQMTTYVQNSGMDSPDRLDALVWAVFDLIISPQASGTVVASGEVPRSLY